MAAEDMITDTEFTCPKCGAHSFGTSCREPVGLRFKTEAERDAFWLENAIGECHGACDFTWPRKDDAKYFKPTGRLRPKYIEARVGRIVPIAGTHVCASGNCPVCRKEAT